MQLSCQLESGIFVEMAAGDRKSSDFQQFQRFFCQKRRGLQAKSLNFDRNEEYSRCLMLSFWLVASIKIYANEQIMIFQILRQSVVF